MKFSPIRCGLVLKEKTVKQNSNDSTHNEDLPRLEMQHLYLYQKNIHHLNLRFFYFSLQFFSMIIVIRH